MLHMYVTDWDEQTNIILALLALLPPSARGRGGIKKSSLADACDNLIIFQEVKD